MTTVARRNDESGEFSEGSQEIDHSNSGNEGEPVDSDYDTPGDISDPENPENQEPGTERRVDDDEDRSNPQYIPKRGTFYEHDDRTADNGEESTNTTSELSAEKEGSETGTERRRPPRKSDVINKWSHDKFNENEQMPKSRDELVAIYGYDIRNEDAPPHARRNRRYGRGPNKYTRTWEDEEAYKRQAAAQTQPRKPPNPEDFPELDAAAKKYTRRPVLARSLSQPESTESSAPSTPGRRAAPRRRPQPAIKSGVRATVRTPPSKHGRPPRESGDVRNSDPRNPRNSLDKNDRSIPDARSDARNTSGDIRNTSGDLRNNSGDVRNNSDVRNTSGDVRNTSGDVRNNGDVRNTSGDVRNTIDVRNTSGDVRNQKENDVRREKMPQIENLSIAVSNSEGPSQRKVLAPLGQQRPVPTEHAKKKPLAAPKAAGPAPAQKQTQPAASSEARGSKRYSSLRQRPLAEPTAPPPPGPATAPAYAAPAHNVAQHRYTGPPGAEFPAAGAAHTPNHVMHQQVVRSAAHAASPPHPLAPPAAHAQQNAKYEDAKYEVRLGLMEQQQLAQHQAPQVAPPPLQMHSLPQQHAIGQMQTPLQPTQGYAPPAMMPAQYMQSGSGGGVYPGAGLYGSAPAQYSHAPIYPHHNYATQAGGVTYFSCAEQETVPQRAARRPTAAIPIVKPNQPERPANSTENDNIDRIVENMFVRKPWPAAHNANCKEKSQSERSSSEPASKELSQPNSLTSSVSTDSKPMDSLDKEELRDTVADKIEITEPKPSTETPEDFPPPPEPLESEAPEA